MKYTEDQFTKDNPCQEGFDDVKSMGFDFVSYWTKCARPDWLMWLLEKNSLISADQVVKLTSIFTDRAMQRYSKVHPDDSKSAALVAAVKAYDLNPTPATKSQIEALQKSGNGAFDCASVFQKTGVVDTSAVRSAMATDLNYIMYGIEYNTPEYQSAIDAAMMDQAEVVRSVVPNPFE